MICIGQMIRTRQLISFLNIKPPPALFNDVPKLGAKWYPTGVTNPIQFGVFVEAYIHNFLQTIPSETKMDTIIELDTFLSSCQLTYPPNMRANIELNQGHLSGHPDLMDFREGIIFDVKTTGQFSKIKTDTIHQLLIYFCLCQLMGLKTIHSGMFTKIGLILPCQQQVTIVDLSKWQWRLYWSEVECVLNKLTLVYNPYKINIFYTQHKHLVGNHVCQSQIFHQTPIHLPAIQFFASSNRSALIKVSNTNKRKLLDYIYTRKMWRYTSIHAPYTLNLCRKYEDNWVSSMLAQQLIFAAEIGVSAVVIHTGIWSKEMKLSGITEEQAIDVMRYNIIDALMRYNESTVEKRVQTRLLLETPAGETGETLADIADFISFVSDFDDQIGICVDTCHVFSSKYDPMVYITRIYEANLKIDLIHFNDSSTECGGCCDRHARVGYGWIGIERMMDVAKYCVGQNIPMVIE